mgnify:CR=1 FL=1
MCGAGGRGGRRAPAPLPLPNLIGQLLHKQLADISAHAHAHAHLLLPFNPFLRLRDEIERRCGQRSPAPAPPTPWPVIGKHWSAALPHRQRSPTLPCFASISSGSAAPSSHHVFDLALSQEDVSRTLEGVPVYTVSNAGNEFVLVSDPEGSKSLSLLCFRQQDAEALLSQVHCHNFSQMSLFSINSSINCGSFD